MIEYPDSTNEDELPPSKDEKAIRIISNPLFEDSYFLSTEDGENISNTPSVNKDDTINDGLREHFDMEQLILRGCNLNSDDMTYLMAERPPSSETEENIASSYGTFDSHVNKSAKLDENIMKSWLSQDSSDTWSLNGVETQNLIEPRSEESDMEEFTLSDVIREELNSYRKYGNYLNYNSFNKSKHEWSNDKNHVDSKDKDGSNEIQVGRNNSSNRVYLKEIPSKLSVNTGIDSVEVNALSIGDSQSSAVKDTTLSKSYITQAQKKDYKKPQTVYIDSENSYIFSPLTSLENDNMDRDDCAETRNIQNVSDSKKEKEYCNNLNELGVIPDGNSKTSKEVSSKYVSDELHSNLLKQSQQPKPRPLRKREKRCLGSKHADKKEARTLKFPCTHCNIDYECGLIKTENKDRQPKNTYGSGIDLFSCKNIKNLFVPLSDYEDSATVVDNMKNESSTSQEVFVALNGNSVDVLQENVPYDVANNVPNTEKKLNLQSEIERQSALVENPENSLIKQPKTTISVEDLSSHEKDSVVVDDCQIQPALVSEDRASKIGEDKELCPERLEPVGYQEDTQKEKREESTFSILKTTEKRKKLPNTLEEDFKETTQDETNIAVIDNNIKTEDNRTSITSSHPSEPKHVKFADENKVEKELLMEPVAANKQKETHKLQETQPDLDTALRFMTEAYPKHEDEHMTSDSQSSLMDQVPVKSARKESPSAKENFEEPKLFQSDQGNSDNKESENFGHYPRSSEKSNDPIIVLEHKIKGPKPKSGNKFSKFFKSFRNKIAKNT